MKLQLDSLAVENQSCVFIEAVKKQHFLQTGVRTGPTLVEKKQTVQDAGMCNSDVNIKERR